MIGSRKLIKKIALPNSWKLILKSEDSLKTKVKTQLKTEIYVSKGKTIDLNYINNKIIYNNLVDCKFSKPYVHTYWDTYFNYIINWENEYNIFHKFNDNRAKQFKLKLIIK